MTTTKYAQQNYLEGLQYAILDARATRLVIEELTPSAKWTLKKVDGLICRLERRAEELQETIGG